MTIKKSANTRVFTILATVGNYEHFGKNLVLSEHYQLLVLKDQLWCLVTFTFLQLNASRII